MKRLVLAIVAAAGCTAGSPTPSEQPFKLGTFELDGEPFVGVVLLDSVVIDVATAHQAVGASAETV